MNSTSSIRFNAALPADCRTRLMEMAGEVNFDEGRTSSARAVAPTGSGSSARAR